MLLELHIIQNFAPSNLNRDDTGSPKSCEFGGYRRARISSQAIKRAIRMEFLDAGLLPADSLAERSKRFVEMIAGRLVESGRPETDAIRVAESVLGALEIKTAPDKNAEYTAALVKGGDEHTFHKTQYLLYLGGSEQKQLVDFCLTHWDALAGIGATNAKGKDAKKSVKEAVIAAVGKKNVDSLTQSLDGGRAANLALFGRMLADLPERNVDAASQVAHAISTHQVALEFDYYTAVDDRKPDDTAGADMIGTVEFNSACFYRYANIDLKQLKKNLGDDANLAVAAVEAFLVASRDAIPTGKQNSFAARNAPSFVLAVVRERGAWSLANAFATPVRPGQEGLVNASIRALDTHWGGLVEMYGEPAGLTLAACALGDAPLDKLREHSTGTFAELQDKVVETVRKALAG